MKLVFTFIEWAFIILSALVILTQIFVPAVRGTLLFPIFRREHKLKEQLLEENQAEYEAELEDQLAQRRSEFYGTTTKEATDAALAADMKVRRERANAAAKNL